MAVRHVGVDDVAGSRATGQVQPATLADREQLDGVHPPDLAAIGVDHAPGVQRDALLEEAVSAGWSR